MILQIFIHMLYTKLVVLLMLLRKLEFLIRKITKPFLNITPQQKKSYINVYIQLLVKCLFAPFLN